DGVLHTSKRSIHFVFNNPLRIKKQLLRAHVQVDPFVRNLRVQDEGDWYQGRLVFAGDFQPSTTYRITIAGLRDRFGGRQREVLRQRVEMLPLGASVSMPEGFVALDKAHTLSFTIDSRNAKSAVLRLWRVDDNNLDDFRRAMEFIDKRQRGELSTAAPQVVNITISPKRDALVHTRVDLSDKLKPNASYLAELRLKEAAFGAIPTSHHASAAAAKPALALLRGGGDSSLSAMVHSGPNNTLIYVTRRRDGQPVAGAQIRLLPGNTVATSDDQGVAVLAVDSRKANHQLLRVSAGGQQLVMPLDARMVSAEQLFPALDGAEVGGAQRALVMTDRGIYRPGATIRLKGSLFTSQRGRLKPVTATTLRLVVLDAQDDKVCDTAVTSTALGGVAADCTLTARARMGLYRAELRDATSAQLLAKRQLRVAAFVPPRFKLEVSANASTNTAGAMVLRGKVAGRYLFGAPMDGAAVAWSVQRQPAPFPRGPHSAAGLVFARESSWRDDEQADEGNWSRTGRGTLDASGTLALVEPLELGTAHTPMRFTLAADVHDDTHQHVAGRQQLVVHPAPRYAGVKVDRRWVDAGEVLHIKLGVMDTAGKPVVGANVVARLQAVEWKYEAQRGAGGALHHHWRQSQREVARCAVSSATRASDCELKVPAGGDYLVVSEVDGRQGGTRSVWA
ncbi:MAG TPA: hypothetical protein ENK23_04495, partial [Sorangium sp.]|nr:hypothetical protein [Sorangium sp.]